MRILIVSNMFPGRRNRNFGVFVADRSDAYMQLGEEVRIAAITDPRKGWIVPIKYLGLLLRALWIAARWRPQIVEAHYLHPTGAIGGLAAAVAGAVLVVHAHGSDVFEARPPSVMERWALGRCAEVHANSHATARAVSARHPGVSVEVIPPGVELGSFQPSFEPRPATIGFVGTMADYKGIDVLVDTLGDLPGAWTAELVGVGPMLNAVRQRIRELGIDDRVIMHGPKLRSDLPDFYRCLAVLVVPSRREAFGQVAVEALATGTPVVVTNVGGLAAVPDTECGSVVPSGDRVALAAGVNTWLGRRSEETPKRAAVQRAAEFDLLPAARRALARYRDIVAVH